MMNIQFELNLEGSERELLAKILEKKPEQLEEVLKDYASAALEEYYRMMLGQKSFGRVQDIKEYRLLLLIKHVFKDSLPSEQQIAALFQITGSASRSLLRNTVAKYQHEMDEIIRNILIEKIKEAKDNDGTSYCFSTDTTIIIEEMNKLLHKAEEKTHPPVIKKKDTVSSYIIQKSSYNALKKLLEIE
jgi:hypothetical protein